MSGRINKSLSVDEEIEERLRRLRENDAKDESTRTDQKEIENRLALLKGIDPNRYSAPPITVYQHTIHKTDTEKADDLMKQFVEELTIDERRSTFRRRSSTDEDIEKRLSRLRGVQSDAKPKRSALMDVDSDSDGESEESNVIERLLAESQLPSIPGDCNDNEESVQMGNDLLPWCTICNEDARLVCEDCNRDLYCRQCFADFHDDYDLKKHKTFPFKAPKTST